MPTHKIQFSCRLQSLTDAFRQRITCATGKIKVLDVCGGFGKSPCVCDTGTIWPAFAGYRTRRLSSTPPSQVANVISLIQLVSRPTGRLLMFRVIKTSWYFKCNDRPNGSERAGGKKEKRTCAYRELRSRYAPAEARDCILGSTYIGGPPHSSLIYGVCPRAGSFFGGGAEPCMTNSTEWGLRSMQDDPDSDSWGGQSVFNVYSKAQGTGLDGTKYRDW